MTRQSPRSHRPSQLTLVALGALSALAGLASREAHAQSYGSSQVAQAYAALAGGTSIDLTFISEGGGELVPIGFPFRFYGRAYREVNVGVDGVLAFAPSCTDDAECSFGSCDAGACAIAYFPLAPASGIPTADEPNATIAAFWDDLYAELDVAAPTTIRYRTSGTAPNRTFTVEWRDIRRDHFGSGGGRATFQVRLLEGSNRIQVHYGPFVSGSDDGDWSGVIGLESASGTAGLAPLACAVGQSACGAATLASLTGQRLEYTLPDAPDLAVTLGSPTGSAPGSRVRVPVTAENIGIRTTGAAVDVDVYLSTDAVIAAGQDTRLGRVSIPALAPNGTRTVTLAATLSATIAPGIYRLAAIVDPRNLLGESDETNNVIVADTAFLVGNDVSVAIDAIPAIGPNERVRFPVRLRNNGAAIDSVEWAVHLSSRPALDAGAPLLARGHAAVPAVPETTVTATATIPGDFIPGDYYLVAVVDPDNELVEADETNNVAVSPGTTEVRGADVVASAIDSEVFVFHGEPFSFTVTIENSGDVAATGFEYSVHLSDNLLITINDPELGSYGPFTLAPGERLVERHTVAIPATLERGEYYLGFIADSTSRVLEKLESNNVQHRRGTVTVRDVAPDLASVELAIPASGAAGETAPFSRVIQNLGNAPADVGYEAFLTLDAAVDPATDFSLGTGTLSLARETEDRRADRFRIPPGVPAGSYFVAYVVDQAGQIDELYEDNNVTVSAGQIAVIASELQIRSSAFPLATLDLPYEFALAASGGSGRYAWSIAAGSLPAGLALDGATGLVSGTPTAEGMYPITVAVSDGPRAFERDFVLLVAERAAPLEIATRAVIPAFVGRRYEYPLTAFGGVPPMTWEARSPLPAGLALTPEGVLGGVGEAPASMPINFHVTDATGATADRPIVVRVINGDASIRFSAETLPQATLGVEYSESLEVEPGTGASPFRFELASGALPPGISLEGDRIAGVPTAIGDFMFEVRVSDMRGDFDVNLFVIAVEKASGIGISTTSLPAATTAVDYVEEGGAPVRVRAFSGGDSGAEIGFAILAGALPPGLALDADGVIHGAPTAAGVYSFLVSATDRSGQSDHRALGIVVSDPAGAAPQAGTSSGCGCDVAGEGRPGAGAIAGLALGLALLALRRARTGGRRTVLAILAAAAIAVPSIARAQGAYQTRIDHEDYVPRSGGTPVTFTDFFGGATLDDGTATIALPFPFRFYGDEYSALVAGTNGLVSFDTSQELSGSTSAIPSADDPNALIALVWDDLAVSGATTYLEGTAPHRVFIIQWTGAHQWLAAGSIDFQLWLHEGSGGRFDVRYGPASGLTDLELTTGFESPDGTEGGYLLPCGTTCDAAALTAASGTAYRVFADAGDELVATGLTAPPVVYPGIPFEVEATIESWHRAALGPFRYEIRVVSEDDAAPARPVYTSGRTTLAPFETLASRPSVELPIDLAPGRYHLALAVDPANQIAEPDETNNLVVTADSIRVGPRQPDFEVAGVTPAVASARRGAIVDVGLELANRGNLDGAAGWSLYLSRNEVVSADDLALASGEVTLALLTTSSVTVRAQLPADLAPGSYYVGALIDGDDAVAELDDVDNARVSERPLVITADTLDVATAAVPGAKIGLAYSTYLAASGGDGAYTWSVVQGALPPGLALAADTGEIHGRPSAVGRASFTARVDSGGLSATRDLVLDVASLDGGLAIITRELLPGVVGDAYPPLAVGADPAMAQRIVALGGAGPVTFTLAGVPPPGLTLDADGYLHGQPRDPGDFGVVVEATDGTTTARRELMLTIAEPGRLTLVAASLPEATVDVDYTYRLRAVGATATVAFSTADRLPPGLALTALGEITGRPQTVGTWSFEVTVSEGGGEGAPRDTASFRLGVVSGGALQVTPTSPPVPELGVPYEVVFEAVDGVAPFAWQLEGPTLPRGLRSEIRIVEGRERLAIVGTPEMVQLVSLLVDVDDAAGRHAELPVTFNVVEPAKVTKPRDDGGCGCRETRGSGASPLASLSVIALALVVFARRRRSAVD